MTQLRFDLKYDATDSTWTCTSPDAPEAYGVHSEAYEALLDCAFSAFDMAETPENAPREHQKTYHELNIELFPYTPNEGVEYEPMTRTLSEEQRERAKRFFDGQ